MIDLIIGILDSFKVFDICRNALAWNSKNPKPGCFRKNICNVLSEVTNFPQVILIL